ncbi:3-phosphoserine/phosphohydroxythreonine transaminase [Saccharicrinis sp. FJH54]|uniref:3-phosphoserine/phosphohydroxythreonine transaminase n=1 Tax=Saccharicrinis sp. FJH54 TaxID=3344665 RepID=UPI0035D41DAB
MKKHNFYAGPSILSEFAIKNTAEAVLNFEGSGLSILEISHRSKEFIAVMSEAQKLVKELLDVPAGYEVLFLGGGASMQFAMVPYNLLKTKAAYLDTGSWAAKAIKEAKFFGETVVVASSKADNYTYIPKGYEVPSDADYFHYTSNNTIFGTEVKSDPEVGVPLVADMSSDIFSRPVDVSKYALIYGGAQKNLGPSGTAFVIVKEDLLGKVDRPIPTMLDYRTHIASESMFNTPPCAPIYTSLQTLKWYKQLGGISAIEKLKKQKSDLLYGEIDRNSLFRGTVANAEDRSDMNITFVMSEEYKEKEADFLALASQKGIVGIKGHRSVGGFRASVYNAMPIESVQVLVDAMKEFEKSI